MTQIKSNIILPALAYAVSVISFCLGVYFPLLSTGYKVFGHGVFMQGVNLLDSKWSKYAGSLDKWNMIDVFLVALLLLNFKMDYSIIKMELSLGATFVAISVIMRIVTIIMIDRIKKLKE